MTRTERLAAMCGKVSVFVGRCCGVFYLAAVALSLCEVFFRYALDAPTVWAAESVTALCASAWLLSGAAVARQRRHIVVTAMELLVGKNSWRRLAKLSILLSMLAVAGLLAAGWEPMLASLNAVQRSGSAFNPPTPTYFKTLLVAACALYFLQLAANLCDAFAADKKQGDDKNSENGRAAGDADGD